MMHKFTDSTHQSVAWFKRVSDEGNLEMTPPYQRNPVWSEKQKGSLIETILLEYPIPEIYMQSTVDERGLEKHVVVDGQQRIRSILEYIAGDYEINEENSRWNGMSFDDLSGGDKKKIYEYKFLIRTLPIVPDEQIRAIFQRINRNTVTLNAQELRHATYWGEFIKLMEEIADYQIWEQIGIFSANDRRRMLDAEYVSEIAVAYLNGLQNKKIKLEDYYQIYEREFDAGAKLRSVFHKVLGEIEQMLPEISYTRWRKKSDFYTLFLVMAKYVDRLPLAADRRADLSGILVRFAHDIDEVLRGSTASRETFIDRYAYAVDRAASDLGSRRAREESLNIVVQHVIKPAENTEQQGVPALPLEQEVS